MKKLRELTTRYSLHDLVEAIVDGETAPPVRPEGEKEFVKLHRTEKITDPDHLGNQSFSGKVKKDTSRAGRKPLPGFPPDTGPKYYPAPSEETEQSWDLDEYGRFRRIDEGGPTKKHFQMAAETIRALPPKDRVKHAEKHAEWFMKSNKRFNYAKFMDACDVYDKQGNYHKEETELDEADARKPETRREMARIARPKFDARGNVVLTKKAAANKGVYRSTSRKIKWGRSYDPEKMKRFGEEKEIDEEHWATSTPGNSQTYYGGGGKGGNKDKKETVLVSPKGYKGGGKVKRIPKSEYDPKKHTLAEETQLDETITKDTPVGDVIHDFVHSDNKVFSGDSKKQRIKRALGAYYGKQRGE